MLWDLVVVLKTGQAFAIGCKTQEDAIGKAKAIERKKDDWIYTATADERGIVHHWPRADMAFLRVQPGPDPLPASSGTSGPQPADPGPNPPKGSDSGTAAATAAPPDPAAAVPAPSPGAAKGN